MLKRALCHDEHRAASWGSHAQEGSQGGVVKEVHARRCAAQGHEALRAGDLLERCRRRRRRHIRRRLSVARKQLALDALVLVGPRVEHGGEGRDSVDQERALHTHEGVVVDGVDACAHLVPLL